MKPAKKVLGGVYKVIESFGIFNEGENIYLVEDDGADVAYFTKNKDRTDGTQLYLCSMSSVEFIGGPQPDFDKLPIGTKLWNKKLGYRVEVINYLNYEVIQNNKTGSLDINCIKNYYSLTPPETVTINGKKYKVTEELSKILYELEEVE